MKTLKLLLSVTLMVLLTISAYAQGVEKTLIKSFNLQGNQVVELDIPGNVDVQHWNSDIMRVQINVQISNTTESILKSLVRAGRYNLKSKAIEDALQVYAPGLEREVRIKGLQLEEKLSYVIYVPEDTQVILSDTASANTSTSEKDTSIK